ncbi:MAG TPA: shikimate kinase [Bacteroidetes bacterium]|nr:shikimate kinase [Bacteroidota bacterium]
MSLKLYLTGFMGSGKTTIGKQLADALGLPFVDLDGRLEEKTGTSIARIFAERGEGEFRKMEAEVLRETANEGPAVFATGGGTPCFYNNMEWMNENGITLYLEVPPAVLLERLKNGTALRPLLKGKTDAQLLSFIENKLEERRPFYEKANLACRADCPLPEVIESIVPYFKRFQIRK